MPERCLQRSVHCTRSHVRVNSSRRCCHGERREVLLFEVDVAACKRWPRAKSKGINRRLALRPFLVNCVRHTFFSSDHKWLEISGRTTPVQALQHCTPPRSKALMPSIDSTVACDFNSHGDCNALRHGSASGGPEGGRVQRSLPEGLPAASRLADRRLPVDSASYC